jgi:hypothetical protein
VWPILRAERNCEDFHRIRKRLAGTEVTIGFSGHQFPGITALMAFHADVIREPSGKIRRVDDRPVWRTSQRLALQSLFYVQLAGTMAIFASNRKFMERRISKKPWAVRHGPRAAAVASDAELRYRTQKGVIGELVAGRKALRTRVCVVTKRRLKKIAALTDDKSCSVLACADHVSDTLRVAENHAPAGSRLRLSLIKRIVLPERFKIAVHSRHAHGGGHRQDGLVIRQSHGTAHRRPYIAAVNVRVALSASL